MIIVLEPDAGEDRVEAVSERVREHGLEAHVSRGERRTVVGCVGDEARLVDVPFAAMQAVEAVHPIERPYRMAAREFRAGPTRFPVGDHHVGGTFTVMAGPCSVENEEMMIRTARAVAEAGAHVLRGGAFKPRTSPYSFRGLGEEALRILARAREETGIPVITEVLDPRQVELVERHADVLQIGSRNMKNYDLLEEVGKAETPVFLKRGMASTIRDFLLAAEYVLNAGNPHVMLCERGIKTFSEETRNTLDMSAIPVLRRETHLPVIVDPAHATGDRDLVTPLAVAAAAAGADGIMVEVHPDPDRALSDGPQSLTFEGFRELMSQVGPAVELARRNGTGERDLAPAV